VEAVTTVLKIKWTSCEGSLIALSFGALPGGWVDQSPGSSPFVGSAQVFKNQGHYGKGEPGGG